MKKVSAKQVNAAGSEMARLIARYGAHDQSALRAAVKYQELITVWEQQNPGRKWGTMQRKSNPKRKRAKAASARTASAKRKAAPKRARKMTLLSRNPDHAIWVQIMRGGKWHDVDGYGNEVVAAAIANVLGNAGYTARVVRK